MSEAVRHNHDAGSEGDGRRSGIEKCKKDKSSDDEAVGEVVFVAS